MRFYIFMFNCCLIEFNCTNIKFIHIGYTVHTQIQDICIHYIQFCQDYRENENQQYSESPGPDLRTAAVE